MTKMSVRTPEEQARLQQQASGIKKDLTPDTGPTSLIMGQSTPMNLQSPLQNNPPQNRPINMRSNQAQLRVQNSRANLQRQLGDRYSAFEEERKRIQQNRRGIGDKKNNQALRELRAKYGLGGQGQTNNPTQNNFNQLRGALNPQQPQQNAQQPQGAALSQLAAQQPTGQPTISKDGMNWQNRQPRPELPGILNQQNSQQMAQPQQSNPAQPQQAAQPPAQQASQPEQAAPAQDNSSIDQQIAALQQQIAQLQAQKK